MLEEAHVLERAVARVFVLAQLVDHQPAVAVELVDPLGFPRQPGGMGHARVLAHELLERLALGRPPRGVVPGAGLRPEHVCHAQRLEPLDVRLDLVNRIERIVLAVHDVERRIRQVVAVHLAVGAVVGMANHGDAAVERQVRRPRVRLLERHVIHARAAVGNAGEVDARLVDVVLALERIDRPQDIVDLLFVPPLRRRPAARVQIDLFLSRDAIGPRSGCGAAGCDRVGRWPSHAAVQLHAQLQRLRGIVIGRHVGHVVEERTRLRFPAKGILAALFVQVGAAFLEPRVGGLERHAGRGDLFRHDQRVSGTFGREELVEQRIGRRGRLRRQAGAPTTRTLRGGVEAGRQRDCQNDAARRNWASHRFHPAERIAQNSDSTIAVAPHTFSPSMS